MSLSSTALPSLFKVSGSGPSSKSNKIKTELMNSMAQWITGSKNNNNKKETTTTKHENWVPIPILGSQHQCQISYAVNSGAVRNSHRRIIWIQQTESSGLTEKACPNRVKCGGTEWTPVSSSDLHLCSWYLHIHIHMCCMYTGMYHIHTPHIK